MNVEIGDGVGGGAREAGDGRVSSDGQPGRAMQKRSAQVLTLLGPPSFCIPSIESVAVMVATDPNTRKDGARYGRRTGVAFVDGEGPAESDIPL
jgi:hypothetical protein